MFTKCLVLWIAYLLSGTSASVAPFIKPCKALDSECIVKSAKLALPHVVKGIKEFGVTAMEPLPIKDVKADTGELKLSLRKLVIHNLSKCNIVLITRNPAKSAGSIVIECPLAIKGEYTLGGKLFHLDIFGDDKFEIEGGVLRASADLKFKTFEKNGKKHYKISGFDYSFEPISKYNINFKNLFNGDKTKADPIIKVMNDSWKELILDVGNPVIKEGMTSLVNNVDKLFQAVPAEDLEIA